MKVLKLTDAEADILSAVLGFVEAGEVSGGPLDDESGRQRAANERVFNSLYRKVTKL